MQKMGFAESWIGLGYEMHQHDYLCHPHKAGGSTFTLSLPAVCRGFVCNA